MKVFWRILVAASLCWLTAMALIGSKCLEAAGKAPAPVVDCRGDHVGVLVRDFDRRLWRVDVCAVAQSDNDGSEFKTEVRE